MTKRSLICAAAAVSALVVSCSPKTPRPSVDPDMGLKDAYSDAFLIGTAVNRFILSGRDTLSYNILLKDFNAMSPENDMKPEVLHPTPDTWNFTAADQYVAFGKEHGMWLLGHTLCWHNQTPDFFWTRKDGKPMSKDEIFASIEDYIKVVCTHFAGKVDAWDVINEIVSEQGGYRDLGWVHALGGDQDLVDEFVKHVFRCAEKYAPDTQLYYNDFNAWRPEKVAGICRIVKMLQAEGIRIDGVGIQAHWGLDFPKNQYIEDAIDAYSALGMRVNITEFDMDVLPFTRAVQVFGWQGMKDPMYQLEEYEEFLDPYKDGIPAEIEAAHAARFKEIMEIFYKHRSQIDRVTFWGINDRMSWKNGYPVPNRTNYSLLWQRDFTPHAAYGEIMAVPQK